MIWGMNTTGDKHEFDPKLFNAKKTNGTHENMATNGSETDSRSPRRHPSTGIDVLIVGAGMGGLMATLECWRKGHNVVAILERNDGPVYSGTSLPFLSPSLFETHIS
jgi:NADPH-dependent 2,4-dienoyl-CoA reductase/sulfur reductase-like enzyme